MTLHDVGGVTAGVGDGIMDPGCIDDMLPQKIRTDVHQLHGVERTAPQMGLDRRVGRDAVKAVEHLAVGKRGQIAHAGRVGRVPAERCVQCVEHAIASQKCLGGAVFLRRAAEIDHRARCTGRFQIGLDGKRRSERTDAEQVMPTAVSGTARHQLFPMRAARLLA